MKQMVCKRRYYYAPLVLVAIAAFGVIVMLLWNSLMPVIFNLPILSFWQAVGLLILGRLFFGVRHPLYRWRDDHHRSKIREKIAKMTPEERCAFFRSMRSHHHHWHHEFCNDEESMKEPDKKENE